jgi:hypothetical protein
MLEIETDTDSENVPFDHMCSCFEHRYGREFALKCSRYTFLLAIFSLIVGTIYDIIKVILCEIDCDPLLKSIILIVVFRPILILGFGAAYDSLLTKIRKEKEAINGQLISII